MIKPVNPSKWNVETLAHLSGVTQVHHVLPNGGAWGTYRRSIIHFNGDQWTRTAVFPFVFPRDFFGFSRLTARPTRADKCNLYINSKGKLLGIRGGKVYRLDERSTLQPLFSIQGDCVLHGSLAEDMEGWTYFGEYFRNSNRGPVRLWRVSPNLDKYEIAHEFTAGQIRHIHGIYPDPFEPGALWLLTGDYADECYFFRTRDRFVTMERFGDGSQIFRAVRLFFTSDHICWLTDSHLDQNYACRMARKDMRIEYGEPIGCSVWYGTTTVEGVHVAFTTVEQGPAIQREESSILMSEDGFLWQEIRAYKKDGLKPYRIFKYGVISCPSGDISLEHFYISGEGLKGLDGVSELLRFSREH